MNSLKTVKLLLLSGVKLDLGLLRMIYNAMESKGEYADPIIAPVLILKHFSP